MSNTYETKQTKLLRGDGGETEAFNEIPGLTNIDPIGSARGLIDVTTLSDTRRKYKMNIPDGQEISLEGFYDPDDSEHSGLRTDMENSVERNFKLELTDLSPATVISFTALVMSWNLGSPLDGVYPLRVTLKPISDLVFA